MTAKFNPAYLELMKHLFHVLAFAFLLMPIAMTASADNAVQKAYAKNVKTQMKNIREALKNKKGSDAFQKVQELRKDSAQMWNPQLLQYGVEACRLLNDAENEKFYLKSKPDTTAFFNTLYNIFDYALLTDSAESMKVNADTVIGKPYNYHFRRQNAILLASFYNNLSAAPLYFNRNAKWADTEKFCAMVIDAPRSPLLLSLQRPLVDPAKLTRMATMHVTSCYNQQKYKDIERFADIAVHDSVNYEVVLEKLTYAETELGDTARFAPRLCAGNIAFPTNMFFFTRLVDYYLIREDYQSVMSTANYSLEYVLSHAQTSAIDSAAHYPLPNEDIARFFEAKAIAYHNTYHPEKCIEEAKNTLLWDPSHPRVDIYIGYSYYNLAENVKIPASITDPEYKKAKDQRNGYLSLARPYLEKYREKNPDDVEQWAPLLYEVYLYLNLGPEFEEISRYIK